MVSADESLRELVCGPAQSLRIVMKMRHGIYAQTADGRPLCVVTRDATRLPFSLVSPELSSDLTALSNQEPGGASVGAGQVKLEHRSYVVGRWVRQTPAVPVPINRTVVDRATELLRQTCCEEFIGVPPLLVDQLETALRIPVDGSSIAAATARLVGRGPGLTPAADDVLAGLVVALRGVGHAALRVLTAAIETQLDRTTWLSAALLRSTLAGQPTAELGRLTAAITGSETTWMLAVRSLMQLGHTSGAATAYGFAVGICLAAQGDCRAVQGDCRAVEGDCQ